jgi:hypothetical protein
MPGSKFSSEIKAQVRENAGYLCEYCHTNEKWQYINLRTQGWSDHFIWSADTLSILGLSQVGRATIALLKLNRERIQAIRGADHAVGRHPPKGDPLQE